MARMSDKKTGGFELSRHGATDTWLTPPAIIEALGGWRSFDLDPCAAAGMPWRTARRMISPPADGLAATWHGRVWLNPPYGPEMARWLARLAQHGNGLALVFARTETAAFHDHVWPHAAGLLFVHGRLRFHYVDGRPAEASAGAPSVLIAYGDDALARLRRCSIAGTIATPERF